MKNEMKNKLIVLSPVMSAVFSWCTDHFLLAVISLIAIYFCISICSLCRKHENLWLFVLTGIAIIPANIEISMIACGYFFCPWGDAFVFKLCIFPLAYSILFSIEEILLGIIGRLIWKYQYPVWRAEHER